MRSPIRITALSLALLISIFLGTYVTAQFEALRNPIRSSNSLHRTDLASISGAADDKRKALTIEPVPSSNVRTRQSSRDAAPRSLPPATPSFHHTRITRLNSTVVVPNITSLSPSSATALGPGFTLTVNGADFLPEFVIRVDGVDRTTTFVDSTAVTTEIAAAEIASSGTFAVTVFDPTPVVGGESNSLTFNINNPVPAASSISPSSKTAGDSAFTLTVNGTNFVDGAVVRFNGSNRTTTFVDNTALTAQITMADIASSGSHPITVFNPSPGGGTSNAINLTVNNPAPTLSGINPATTTAGSASFTLTVTGTNFVDGAVVRFNGSNRTTTFLDNTEVTADISAADIAAGGTHQITVFNPTPGGGTSNAIDLTVNNPAPNLSSINPTTRTAGSGSFTLTVNGTNFNSSSVIHFNGSNRTTTFVSSTQLTAQMASADTATGGIFPITVLNPTPGGGTSNAVNLIVNNPSPTLSSINPTSRTAGGSAFTLTATGSNFNSSSIIRFNGSDRTTTFVSSTSLTTQIPAADIAIGGTFSITVFNPTPGGGTSSSRTLTVNNPSPTLSSISPTSRTAAGAAFTLTATGTNFNSSSVVRFEGSNRTTTFVSSTQLTAQITASDIADGGTYDITVFNPSPSGGTSSSRTLTVNNPVPTLSSISPTSPIVGVAFTLTVNGTNFVPSSVVRFNGSNRTTTFVSSTQLTAQITAADVATTGTFPIRVFNPTPNGGQSSAVNLTVINPVPASSGLSPSSVPVAGPDFTLTVNGTNFVSSSVVRFNGTNRTTTFVSATQLTALIPATDITNTGIFPITVSNPTPGGGVSNAVNLSVIPSIASLSPASVRAGGVGFALTVNGTGFVVGAVVHLNGTSRSTTFLSSTTLSASIPATDISSVGTFPITVSNPDGLSTSATNLAVIPSLNNLSPLSTIAGSPGFTLTVQGAGFLNGSVVQWNGISRPTTFVSSTRLTTAISAAELALSATVPVTVLNPAPNSLTSNVLNFIVAEPPPATECAAGADVVLAQPGKIEGGAARSQMWFTDDGVWWGAFQNNTDGLYFYKRTSPTTWTKGALIETSIVGGVFAPGAPDCLWTGTNLFILVQESITQLRLYKYTYDPGTQTFSLVSGFPVNLPLIGVGDDGEGQLFGSIAIEQDSTGKLWAAYAGGGILGDGNVRVIYSTSADHRTWNTTGFILATGVSTIDSEGTTIARFGGNKIGVVWSNAVAGEFAFRFHTDGQADTDWSAKEIIDSGLGPQGQGSVVGKQVTMKGHPDGRLFFVGTDSDGSKHLHLYIRSVAGAWGTKALVVNNFNSMPRKPVLLLDLENSVVHVLYKDSAVSANGLMGQTFITQAFMTNPVFNTGCLIIDTPEDAASLSTSNPTSTKQALNATTDLVAAASTGRAGNHILTNVVDLTPKVLTVFSVSPKEVTAGESTSALNLTVNGKLFANGAVIRFNGSDRPTTYVSAGKLTTTLPVADTAIAGNYPITVMNPGGVVSNAVNLVVSATNPVPNVGLVSPNREPVGHPQFTMTVTGTGFRRTSVVRFNGSNRTTTYVTDVQLTATIPASDLLVPGPFPITVFNPAPGGGSSNPKPVTTFYVEPSCNPPSGQSFPGVTLFNTVKSQMWYNDGLWWGAFSDNLSGLYFYKQNGSTYIQGALLESNFNGRPDVLWNGTNLFVLVYEFNTLAKLFKYSYNTVTDTYQLITGFPINLPLTGIGPGVSAAETGSITLAQDSTGKLWAAYPGSFIGGDGNYRVIWSTSADHKTWDTTGFIFDSGGSVDTQEVAPVVHFGGDKIGIAYSKQPTKEILFRYHVDGNPETTWSTAEIADSGLGHLGIGGVADNHMSIKAAPDGRIFLVAKDSDGPGFINLYTRSAAGVWSNPTLVDIDPHSAVTRPTLMLDLENSDAYVFYADATSSFMYMNKTSMNNPVFGPACPYVSELGVSDGTSTKQNLKASMGLRVAGSTGGALSTIHMNPITLMSGSGNAPALNSVSPSSVGLNRSPFTLTLNGSNFASSAVVYVNGSDRATTFVSSTQLTARLMTSDVQTLGTLPITVMNPKGGTSATANLTVNAGPAISSLTPLTAAAASAGFTLTVNGTGFVSGAMVHFNGVSRSTTFVSSTQLSAEILTADIASGGNRAVTVVNPDGGTSAPTIFTVTNPVPTTTTLSPANVIVGGGAFTLTVNGSNFNGSSVVHFNGVARTTTLVNDTQLTAQILAADIAATGTFPVTVLNPAPGGGTSNATNLGVLNPMPALTALSPPSVIAGAGGFTLAVNGSNFITSSIVRLNGVDRATTFVNATQLTAQVTAADAAVAAIIPITIFNPAPGGGTSTPFTLTVNNPLPTVTALAPSDILAGSAAFTLTINGTNFVNGSAVRLNGSNRTTTFVNATQLTAQITAADVQVGATLAITVFTPTPGGGTSNPVNLIVNNALPTVSTISPSSKTAGEAAFTLTVNGTNFNSSSRVRLNGVDRTTSFVSTTQLTAQIAASDVASAGTPSITVFNPTPGGGASNAVNLTVNNPLPTLSTLSPTSKTAGDAAFTLTVNGTNFNSSSIVRWNGVDRATTFVSATQLTAQITTADIQTAGAFPLTVFTPPPGGGTSIPVSFTVNNPLPAVTALAPSDILAGGAVFTLTVNGTKFVNGSVVRLSGSNRTTTFVSATQLTAQITAADVQVGGILPVTVFNATPGGGTSNPVNLTVNNPLPTVSTISPASKTAGDAAFTLTVNGTNFNSSSRVRLNGVDRTTAFVSATQLTAQITAADVASAGSVPITVFNPAPGGGTSTPVNLTVNNPLPAVATLAPSNILAGSATFTLTVNGTNFVNGSVVRLNGNDCTTTFINTTQLTAQIEAAAVQTAGVVPLTVFTPAPGGGTSGAVSFTINNPSPTLSTIAPESKTAGDTAFTLTLSGSNFNSSSIVRLNGVDRTTSLVSATQLTAQITAIDVAAAGAFPITVFNPAPGGGASNAVSLAVNNPLPTITTFAPNDVLAGSAAFTLTVNGTNFVNGSVVHLNGSDRPTAFVDVTQLTVQIPAADVIVGGNLAITVFTPTPGGGTSNPVNLTVNNPLPTVSTISPESKTAGDAAFTLTINGSNFNSSSIVRLNGADRVTTFVSATQLTAQITSADIQTAGVFPLTVFTPEPGGGTSNSIGFTVNNPVPSVTTILPSNKIAGEADHTLTVTGSNFNSNSIVRLNAEDRPTSFVSATQLTAQITAADLAAAGTSSVTVFNPEPGGGSSNPVELTVNNPVPTISTLAPNNILEASDAFTLTVNGTGFVSNSAAHWNGQDRTTTFISSSQLAVEITAADVNSAGTAVVTVSNPDPGASTSGPVMFTIAPNARIVSIISSSGATNSSVTVPIHFATQGNENSISFTLSYDATLLNSPEAILVSGAPGAILSVDTSRLAQGLFGLSVSLPTGESFPFGTTHLVSVTFTTANVASETTTPISFGDQPTGREVVSSSTVHLPTVFVSGTATITLGYEADLAPRPTGSNNGTITVADWTLIGRFTSGLEPLDPGSEFQRADCAPRATLGNGSLTLSDWVQAGRYASGLDPILPAGGPTGPPIQAPALAKGLAMGLVAEGEAVPSTVVSIIDGGSTSNQTKSVSIEVDSLGSENALSFSLSFDSTKLSFVSAEKSEELAAATLIVNSSEAPDGRVGIALALPAGTSLVAGKHRVVVLTFTAVSGEAAVLNFTDLPVAREVVDVNANKINAIYLEPLAWRTFNAAPFFGIQQFSPLLTPQLLGLVPSLCMRCSHGPFLMRQENAPLMLARFQRKSGSGDTVLLTFGKFIQPL